MQAITCDFPHIIPPMPRWSWTFSIQCAVGWEVRKIKVSQVVSKVYAFAFMYKKLHIVCRCKHLKTRKLAISEVITKYEIEGPLKIFG